MSESAHSNPYGPPHPSHEKPAWWERADRIRQELLKWPDVRQLSVFGRMGYYVRNYLFGTVPLSEPKLDVWMRLPDNQRQEYERHALALPSPHGVAGWTRLDIKEDAHVDLALKALKSAYEAACARAGKSGASEVGVPIELVPEAPGKPERKIPQGPRTGRFKTGLDSPGAYPQGAPKASPK